MQNDDRLLSDIKPGLGYVGLTISLATRAQGCASSAITQDLRIKQA